jgi:hypothetical protein
VKPTLDNRGVTFLGGNEGTVKQQTLLEIKPNIRIQRNLVRNSVNITLLVAITIQRRLENVLQLQDCIEQFFPLHFFVCTPQARFETKSGTSSPTKEWYLPSLSTRSRQTNIFSIPVHWMPDSTIKPGLKTNAGPIISLQ